MENKGRYGVVTALTDVGDEVRIFVGGKVEVFFHKGQIKAFVKKNLKKVDITYRKEYYNKGVLGSECDNNLGTKVQHSGSSSKAF